MSANRSASVIGLALLFLLGTACARPEVSRRGTEAASQAVTDEGPISAPVIIFQGSGSSGYSRFDPPPQNAGPHLSASQPVAAFEKLAPDFDPSGVTAQLGRFTDAVGDGTYTVNDQLAWGLSWHECPVVAGGENGLPPPATLPSCTRWLFLDAITEQMLESRWQQK